MLIGNDSHLTYCTNIHPGETWQEVLQNLETYTLPLKERIAPNEKFGIGLRLSNQAAETLVQSDQLLHFKDWLDQHNCYVFTMNGFPYGKFHNRRVKDQVHVPDWHQQKRRDYTNTLFAIMSEILPENIDGGISTSPITYRHWYKGKQKIEDVKIKATRHIIQVVEQLVMFKERQGKIMHLDIEPEPDGLIENTSEFIHFYENYILRIGGRYLSEKIQCTRNEAISHILDHVQMCFDICHSSVEFEDPEMAIREVLGRGINIGKIQISAALKAEIEHNDNQVDRVKEELRKYNEAVYLHQAVVKTDQLAMYKFKDLEPALKALDGRISGELRTHFHVPVFEDNYGLLKSTQDDIEKTLAFWGAYEFCNHLELETYTFDVLPNGAPSDVITSIQNELDWVKSSMSVPV